MKKVFATLLFILLSLSLIHAQENRFKTPDNTKPVFETGTSDRSVVVFEDNFDAYANGNTGTFGGWTTVDVDNAVVGGINGFTFPHSGEALAWTVVDWSPSTTIPAHSGNNTVATMYNTNASANNDWLISPAIQLSSSLLNAQLSFWTYILTTQYGPESITVYISTDPNAVTPAAFTTVLQAMTLSTATTWQEQIFSLEAYKGNTVRIAIKYHSTDVFTVLVDDFKVFADNIVPVELNSFSANVKDGNVLLEWSTATETNNNGFEIERKLDGKYNSVGFVKGKGTATEINRYSFTDKVAPGVYTYRLKQIDLNGTFEYLKEVEVNVSAPAVFALGQNYPNPFNPSTKINFSLAVDSKITLSIYNILGQKISTLISSTLPAGAHSVDFNAAGLNSGVYIYKIEAAGNNGKNFIATKKMILTK